MTGTHHLSQASSLLAGAAVFEPHKRLYDGRRGYLLGIPAFVGFGAVLAVLAAGLVDAATSTNLPNAATITYTPATDGTAPLNNASRPAPVTVKNISGASVLAYPLDVPRNITLNVTHGSSIVAMTCLVSGLDKYMQPMSELLSITATGTTKTVSGKKAFAWLTSFAFTSAGNATTNTANVAWGNVLGLPYRIDQPERLFPAGNAIVDVSGTTTKADDTSPATSTTGDPRGTWAPASAPDGTKTYAAILFPTDPSVAQPLGLFGNVPA